MYFYQFHLRDYLAKTRHLSLIEDLAYRRLLDAYYTAEGPLPASADACARLICMRDHAAEVEAVLSEFFVSTDGGWSNPRCEEEIERFRKMRTAGAHGAAKRWGNGGANGVPSPTPIATKNQEPRTRKKPTHKPPEGDEGFDEFWSVYPKKDAKDPARKAWAKIAPDSALRDQIVAAVKARAQTKDWTKDGGQYVPMAATFLNQRRWEDEASEATSFWSEVEKEPWA